MKLESILQRSNLPNSSNEYKVILVKLDNELYLRFSEEPTWIHSLHADILRTFLEENKIPYDKIARGEKRKIPKYIGERYETLNMGKADVDLENNHIYFGGYSRDYPLSINREMIGLIQPLLPELKIEYKNLE